LLGFPRAFPDVSVPCSNWGERSVLHSAISILQHSTHVFHDNHHPHRSYSTPRRQSPKTDPQQPTKRNTHQLYYPLSLYVHQLVLETVRSREGLILSFSLLLVRVEVHVGGCAFRIRCIPGGEVMGMGGLCCLVGCLGGRFGFEWDRME
jgi:hypothetical protein